VRKSINERFQRRIIDHWKQRVDFVQTNQPGLPDRGRRWTGSDRTLLPRMRERIEGRSGDRPSFRLGRTSLIAKADSECERFQSPRAAPQDCEGCGGKKLYPSN
jgi:hypothetical protein